ncbi:BLUF domain-containing protein [Methylobacterium sp. JK268]
MEDLYRLVYASRNLLKPGEAEAAIAQILDASRRNNRTAGVTGALMFNAGAFAQVLEGPRRGVEATFERIQRDLRHSDVTVLQCGPAERRGFADWAMAFVGQSEEGRARWSRLARESGFDPGRLDGDAVLAMLHGLVLEEEDLCGPPGPLPEAPAEPSGSFDADQVRAELVALHPAPPPAAPPAAASASEGALAVLRAALAEERGRTTQLREEVDGLRIALALARDEAEVLARERGAWAERARLLAAALHQEAAAAVAEAGSATGRTARTAA